jgi:hypothetical protein
VTYTDFEFGLTAMPRGDTPSEMLARLLGESIPKEPTSYWEIELPPVFAT